MAEPLAPYEMLCGLLVPLYVPRATEEVLYGRRGVTLQTSREVTGRAFMKQTQRVVNIGHLQGTDGTAVGQLALSSADQDTAPSVSTQHGHPH